MRAARLLLAPVSDVVVRNFPGGKHERQAVSNIVYIFWRYANAFQCVTRVGNLLDDSFALIVEADIESFVVLAVGKAAIVEGLHFNYLAVGVVLAGLLRDLLLRSKAINDGAHGYSLGQRRIKRSIFLLLCLRERKGKQNKHQR